MVLSVIIGSVEVIRRCSSRYSVEVVQNHLRRSGGLGGGRLSPIMATRGLGLTLKEESVRRSARLVLVRGCQ